MNLNWLWAAWIATFFILETLGLLHIGGMNPLTTYLRGAIPRYGALMGAAIVWFALHLYVEPFWRKDKIDDNPRG